MILVHDFPCAFVPLNVQCSLVHCASSMGTSKIERVDFQNFWCMSLYISVYRLCSVFSHFGTRFLERRLLRWQEENTLWSETYTSHVPHWACSLGAESIRPLGWIV
jgi:hypothetical protein